MHYVDLTPTEALVRLQDDPPPIVLDVRTAPEHASHRIASALLIPVQELADRLDELPHSASGYVVICEHGVRSVTACAILSAAGVGPLANVRGGMARWIGEGLEHRRGVPKRPS